MEYVRNGKKGGMYYIDSMWNTFGIFMKIGRMDGLIINIVKFVKRIEHRPMNTSILLIQTSN